MKFLNIALASASEVEYQLEFASQAGIISSRDSELRRAVLVELRKMLAGLIKYLRHENL